MVIKMFKILKQLLFIPILVIFVLGLTWQGKFNPNHIVKWPKKSTRQSYAQYPSKNGIVLIPLSKTIHIVPNGQKVKTIKALYLDHKLVAYAYYEDGKPYMFVYNSKRKEYANRILSKKDIMACARCHKSYKETGKEIPYVPHPPKKETLDCRYDASHKSG